MSYIVTSFSALCSRWRSQEYATLRSFLDFVHRFLDPNISNCRWPSVSFPAVSFFGDCSHAYRSCDLPKTLRFEKCKTSTAQAHDTLGHLVLLDYTPRLTYDRAGFTYKSLRNKSCAKILCIFLTVGAYAPYAPCMSTPLVVHH